MDDENDESRHRSWTTVLSVQKAVKEAAQEAEAELNDDLMNHLCIKNNTRFWEAWRKRFCSKNIKSPSVVNGVSGKEKYF